MNYRMATREDIDLLVSQRLNFIEVDENNTAYNEIRDNCYAYFEKALTENTCDVIIAEDTGKCVGTGIVFYYDSVPSAFNVTGKNAYITSMYVAPDYRRQGIGSTILDKMIGVAMEKGYRIIMLNASDMGKPMYQKRGFVKTSNGMILDKR